MDLYLWSVNLEQVQKLKLRKNNCNIFNIWEPHLKSLNGSVVSIQHDLGQGTSLTRSIPTVAAVNDDGDAWKMKSIENDHLIKINKLPLPRSCD